MMLTMIIYCDGNSDDNDYDCGDIGDDNFAVDYDNNTDDGHDYDVGDDAHDDDCDDRLKYVIAIVEYHASMVIN